MKRLTVIIAGAFAVIVLAYAWSARPIHCSVFANLMGRTDAWFACLMQR